jgi:hypothetical protein
LVYTHTPVSSAGQLDGDGALLRWCDLYLWQASTATGVYELVLRGLQDPPAFGDGVMASPVGRTVFYRQTPYGHPSADKWLVRKRGGRWHIYEPYHTRALMTFNHFPYGWKPSGWCSL